MHIILYSLERTRVGRDHIMDSCRAKVKWIFYLPVSGKFSCQIESSHTLFHSFCRKFCCVTLRGKYLGEIWITDILVLSSIVYD